MKPLLATTEQGSDRLGVRDHVELRLGRRAVQFTAARKYAAESESRVLPRHALSSKRAAAVMYDQVSPRMAPGAPGDDDVSLESAAAALRPNDQLGAETRNPPAHTSSVHV